MDMLNSAKYKCLKCGYEWFGKPGPTVCPDCWYEYVKWENFDEWRKETMKYPYT
jgi:rubrerythrin